MLPKGLKLMVRTRALEITRDSVIVTPADSTLAIQGPSDLLQPRIRHLAMADAETPKEAS